MTRDEAVARLKIHQSSLRSLGVDHLYLFGSTARNQAGKDSDVDLFFDYQKGKIGLYELMDIKAHAAELLGLRTDIISRDSLHPALRPSIEASAVQVF